MIAAALLAATLWTAHPADGVEMHLSRDGEVNRLDFDFHGHGGYAIARRAVDLELPANYQFTFRIRGEAPVETLEFKLIRGDDVWWMNRRDFVFPPDWKTLTTKKRQISFAWGPSAGGEPRHIDAIEVVVTAGSGGKGTVWFTDPVLEELPLVTNEIGGLVIDCADSACRTRCRNAWAISCSSGCRTLRRASRASLGQRATWRRSRSPGRRP